VKTTYPACRRHPRRSVVAHTSDGREITVPTVSLETEILGSDGLALPWSFIARIEASDG